MNYFKVGDLICSKESLLISNLGGIDENVGAGQYFLVVSYGKNNEPGEYGYGEYGCTILCQKSGAYSFWSDSSTEYSPLNESFNKI